MTDDTLQQRILKRWMHPRPQAGAHRSEQRVLDLESRFKAIQEKMSLLETRSGGGPPTIGDHP